MKKFETTHKPLGVIVIIHGAMEHHGRYKWLAQKWNEAGYHVIMGDLPGQGLTERSNLGHIQSFVQYLTEVKSWIFEAYSYELPVFLLGHSMGGLIAIRLLEEGTYNLAGVILSSPCLNLVHKPNAVLNTVSYVLNLFKPKLRMDSGVSPSLATRNKEVIDADAGDTLYVKKVSVRWFRELVSAMRAAFLRNENFQDLPLLVMQGGDDRIVDKHAVKKWFHFCPAHEKHYKEWPNFYHEIFNEPEREEVFNFTRKFVEGCLFGIGYNL
ncbi:MAG: phospholipase [Bacillales bacterium]|jgi:lysophospholipase|nr:phospholipase [Bacillales bacterium]